jgi:hypothetical protein
MAISTASNRFRLEQEGQRNIELMWLTGRLMPDSRRSPTFVATTDRRSAFSY